VTFSDDLDRFLADLERRRRDLFVGVATETLRSIQEGSPLTGAPGQPVDTGNLRASWQLLFESETTALIQTNVIYAPGIEEGLSMTTGQRLVQRSPVGGFHSVKMTRAGFQRIVAAVAQEVTA
jgi:hypothetical protein